MVKKLFKHEFLDNYKNFCILSAMTIILSILIFLFTKFNIDNNLLLWTVGTAFVSVLFANMFLLFANIIQSINAKLFSNQGYLTLVLPTSIEKIIIVKFMVNLIYITLYLIVTMLTLFIIIEGAGVSIGSLISQWNPNIGHMLINILMFVINVFSFISLILLVLTLLNIGKFKKNKLITGIFIYIGIILVINIFNSVQIIPYGLTVNYKVEHLSLGTSYLINFNSLLFNFLTIIIGFFGSVSLIKNKLELE